MLGKRTVLLLIPGALVACSSPAALTSRELRLEVASGGQVALRYADRAEICQANQTCTYQMAPGTSVRLEAQPAENFFFTGWGGACTGYQDCNLSLSEDRRVEARFERLVGGFTLAPLPDPVVVPAGASVELGVDLRASGGFNAPPGRFRSG